MGVFIIGICISLITLGIFLTSLLIYFMLAYAVKNNQEVPKWIYKMGHILKARGSDPYEDITDIRA